MQSYSKDQPSFFGFADVEKRLVEDVKRLSAELAVTRGELESERKSQTDSESALWAQVTKVMALNETTLQSLRDSASAKETLRKELDGSCVSPLCSLLCLPCFCFLIRFLYLVSYSKGEEEPCRGSLFTERNCPD